MGITGKRWSHLVVFTKLCLADDVPPFAIRVEFDQNHFMQLVASSTECWFKYILPEILCGRLKNQLQETQVLDDVQNPTGIVLDPHVLDHMYTRSRITRTQIIAYVEGHLPHQKSLH